MGLGAFFGCLIQRWGKHFSADEYDVVVANMARELVVKPKEQDRLRRGTLGKKYSVVPAAVANQPYLADTLVCVIAASLHLNHSYLVPVERFHFCHYYSLFEVSLTGSVEKLTSTF
ncbi:hypothetical protein NQZ79_g5957 [Umbelopsis isabellina]|nr:hypothetical protein NQZ79_g5957 [Umbelopsis isabellina]